MFILLGCQILLFVIPDLLLKLINLNPLNIFICFEKCLNELELYNKEIFPNLIIDIIPILTFNFIRLSELQELLFNLYIVFRFSFSVAVSYQQCFNYYLFIFVIKKSSKKCVILSLYRNILFELYIFVIEKCFNFFNFLNFIIIFLKISKNI